MQKILPEKRDNSKNKEYEFIGKSLFFTKEKILVIGDLHLGFETMLKEMGSSFPINQIEQTIREIEEILHNLKERKVILNKIVFLGDIKHYFTFKKIEKKYLLEMLDIISKYVPQNKIIFIKGNHEKMDIVDKKFQDYFIYKDVMFIHGDQEFKEILNKNIKRVVMGHLHPAIKISDNQNIRSEKYKCFLVGNYKSKKFFILPSFFPIIEGTSINEYLSENACIIKPSYLQNFNVFAIGEKNSIYDFGKLKNLNIN